MPSNVMQAIEIFKNFLKISWLIGNNVLQYLIRR
jgi:hypothetical protein